MKDFDNFAPIRIDAPQEHQPLTVPDDAPPEPKEGFWSRMMSTVRKMSKHTPDPELMARLAPAEGEAYRMLPMTEVLDALKIAHYGNESYLEELTQTLLSVKLNRLGLSTATGISGPLRLRITDNLPIVWADEPMPSRSASISLCLYLIAWVLQADGATKRDIALADAWIDSYDPKEPWAPAAHAMFRWLISRKLFMTHKRKMRAAKLKRFMNVRGKLLSLLLQIVADPQHASPKRMKRLATVYEAIGLNPADIHADIHRLATTNSFIPTTSKAPSAEINHTLLQEMQRNTQQAQQILANVFADEDEKDAKAASAVKAESPLLSALRELADREEWSREEVAEIAKKHRFTLGAMLEQLNDMAYEMTDDAVADDDGDTIYIDTDIAHQCLENKEL